MNYAQRAKSIRIVQLFVLAMLVLALAVTAIPAQAQTPTTIYALPGGSGQPVNPYDWAIAQGRDGNLYVSSQYGGDEGPGGTVFNVTPSGTPTVVENTIPWPFGETLGTDGNFYGATVFGGTDGLGTVYKLTPKGVLTVLHSFTGAADGDRPISPPIEATSGTFYGTTTSQSVANSTAYSVTSKGVFKTLHTFTGPDGQNAYAQLVQGADGNFYGDTDTGGTSNDGVIFKMTASGTVTVLHNFAGTDGSGPLWALIQASDGNFYGVTNGGGAANAGVIFKITPGGTYTDVHDLNGTTDGSNPFSGLIQATDGNLYGVTSNINSSNAGTIYRVTTGGTFTTLYSFTDSTDGGYPQSPLRQHTNGLLYGSTYIGGDQSCFSVVYINGQPTEVIGCGVIFSLDVGLGPFVNLVTTSGKELSAVEILGQGFSKSSSVVKFGGVAATKITLTGTTYISATVPAGALTGSVTVTTGGTTLTSPQTFKVLPTIKRFTPLSGPVGTPVMITGTGLTQTTKVTFDGVAATTLTVNSDTQVTADVPTGAKTGKIAVTTAGGTASSAAKFTVN
jgi:uncharacterized repeat protein (TIGR03803 family)